MLNIQISCINKTARFSYIIIFFITLIALLCSCTSEERLHPASSVNAIILEKQPIPTESEPNSNSNDNTNNITIRRPVNEYLEYDAETSLPSQAEFLLYRTSSSDLNKETLLQAFLKGTATTTDNSSSGNVYYTDNLTKCILYVDNSNLHYTTNSIYSNIFSLENFGSQFWYSNNDYHNRNLPFIPKEQAVDLLSEKLIGLSDLKIDSSYADIYSFTKQDLQDINNDAIDIFENGVAQAGSSNSIKRNQESLQKRKAYKSELKQDEDKQCYYISARLSFNGIPIYNRPKNYEALPSSVDQDNSVFPPCLFAIVSPDGIESLTIENNISVGEAIERYNSDDILTLEEAMVEFEEKYSKVAAKTEVKSISLCYLFRPEDFTRENRNNYVLAPVWVFEGRRANEQTDWDGPFQPREQFEAIFDAVTGEEIV